MGDYLQPSKSLFTLQGTEHAEIEIPIKIEQAKLLGLYDAGSLEHFEVGVRSVSNDNLVESHSRSAKLISFVKAIDPETRALSAIVELRDPLALSDTGLSPIYLGEYVTVSIVGRVMTNLYRAPVVALYPDSSIVLLSKDSKAIVTPVKVLFRSNGAVYFRADIQPGTELVSTKLDPVIDGMSLKRKAL